MRLLQYILLTGLFLLAAQPIQASSSSLEISTNNIAQPPVKPRAEKKQLRKRNLLEDIPKSNNQVAPEIPFCGRALILF